MARNVRAVASRLGMAHQHSSSTVIGSRTTVACMGIKMAAAAILFLPHLWLSGCLGGRFPEPYYHLDNRHSENYDPRFWLAPYEYPIDAHYYPEDYMDMNYSSNDGFPQDPYLTSLLHLQVVSVHVLLVVSKQVSLGVGDAAGRTGCLQYAIPSGQLMNWE
uniref:(California timema) hypothetical protein n=1 Tax=Timema californicum TaxID=61474 RepID=A0A7R9P6J5_TIMCA|nr:unnamed protein product [Timema californicum]